MRAIFRCLLLLTIHSIPLYSGICKNSRSHEAKMAQEKLESIKDISIGVAVDKFPQLLREVSGAKLSSGEITHLEALFKERVDSISLTNIINPYESIKPNTFSIGAKDLVTSFWSDIEWVNEKDFLASLNGELAKKVAQNGNKIESLTRVLNAENETVRAEIQKSQKEETYIGENMVGDTLSTNPRDLYQLSKAINFKPGERLVDIGSGHGIPSFILGSMNPELQIKGYDFSGPKVNGANRLSSKLNMNNNLKFTEADFAKADFKIEQAEYYYFFNPSTDAAINAVTQKIIDANKGRKVKIIAYLYPKAIKSFTKLGYPNPTPIPGTNSMYQIDLDIPAN